MPYIEEMVYHENGTVEVNIYYTSRYRRNKKHNKQRKDSLNEHTRDFNNQN